MIFYFLEISKYIYIFFYTINGKIYNSDFAGLMYILRESCVALRYFQGEWKQGNLKQNFIYNFVYVNTDIYRDLIYLFYGININIVINKGI